MLCGCLADIPANVITWMVIIMPEENLHLPETFLNTWG